MSGGGAGGGQLVLELGHRAAMGQADLVITAGNRLAVGWLDRWPAWPVHGLVLHGPAGAGKTHLAQVFREASGARPVDPAGLADADPIALAAGARALMVDDADAVAGVPGRERGLLHLLNVVAAGGGSVLLTGRQAPAMWPVGLPDLASRLAALPTVPVPDPDDQALAAVMTKLFRDRQLPLPQPVLRFLLPRMERSFDAAARLVAALDRASLAAGRPLSVALARSVLPELAD